jgi:hypothetical protein
MTQRHVYAVTFREREVRFRVDDDPAETYPLDAAGIVPALLRALSWYAARTDELNCDERLLRLLGRALFEFLFANHDPGIDPQPRRKELRTRFVDLCKESRVHLVLEFTDSAFAHAQLPWEFLWVPDKRDSDLGHHMAAMASASDNVKVTLSRAIDTQLGISKADRPLRILHVTYGASDQAPIRTEKLSAMLGEYQDANPDRLIYHQLSGDDVTWDEIRQAIAEHRPHIFHFSGHGERDALWLAKSDPAIRDEIKKIVITYRRDDDALKRYLEPIANIRDLFDVEEKPQLVVLDACASDTPVAELQPMVAHVLVGVVPAVVAMRYEIGDPSAQRFAVALYQQIVHGRPLDEAVQLARYQLVPHGNNVQSYRAMGTPVLYLKQSESLCAPIVRDSTAPREQPMTPAVRCPWCETPGARQPEDRSCYRCGSWFYCKNPACGTKYQDDRVGRILFCPSGCGQRYEPPTVEQGSGCPAPTPEPEPSEEPPLSRIRLIS